MVAWPILEVQPQRKELVRVVVVLCVVAVLVVVLVVLARHLLAQPPQLGSGVKVLAQLLPSRPGPCTGPVVLVLCVCSLGTGPYVLCSVVLHCNEQGVCTQAAGFVYLCAMSAGCRWGLAKHSWHTSICKVLQ